MARISHWIGGRIAPGTGRTVPVWNPATGEPQSEVDLGGTDDLDAAVASAQAAGQPDGLFNVVVAARWPDPATSSVDLGFPQNI